MFGFGDVFGRAGRGRSRNAGGIDLRYDLEISLEEAAKGLETKIKIPRWEACATCDGTGAKPGSKPVNCPTCGGRGQLRHQQGFFTVTRTCPQCQGMGQVIREMCSHCKGEGRVNAERVLDLRIPAGVDEGTRLRVAGEGGVATRGSAPGDLYVISKSASTLSSSGGATTSTTPFPSPFPRPRWARILSCPPSVARSACASRRARQSGSVFRLRGLGMPILEGRGHGDLYISVFVVTPTRLSRDQRRWLEILAPFVRVDNHPLERRAAEKVKDVFG